MSKVLILLSDGFEEIEALGTVDILRRANIDTVTCGVTGQTVSSARDVQVSADIYITDVNPDEYQMIILPGGQPGADNIKASAEAGKLLKFFADTDRYIAAICASPYVLSHHGLTKGKTVTSYPAYEDKIDSAEYTTDKVVQDGKLITGRGPGTMQDFAFKIVEILRDKRLVKVLREAMLYG